MPHCRSCRRGIVWITMKGTGKRMPVDADSIEQRVVLVDTGEGIVGEIMRTGVSHFATCPNAGQHRRRGGSS